MVNRAYGPKTARMGCSVPLFREVTVHWDATRGRDATCTGVRARVLNAQCRASSALCHAFVSLENVMVANRWLMFGMLVGCGPQSLTFTHPDGFGDVCSTDADCTGNYHCSAPQGGRCTLYCPQSDMDSNACDLAQADCDYCPSRCSDASGGGYCDGRCATIPDDTAQVVECLVSYQ